MRRKTIRRFVTGFWAWFWIAAAINLSLAGFATLAIAEEQVAEKKANAETQMAKLVEQLGAENFATRERAQGELQRLGLMAFDVLQEAQHNDDIEIALRARYLLRVMPISWSREGDTREIRNILKNYGEQGEDERKSRMDRLAGLAGTPATVALCRLARFETNNLLSKRAALLMMNAPLPETAEARATVVATIKNVVGTSKRASARWLMAFANTLTDPEASLEEWQKLAQIELDTFRNSPEQTTQEMLRDLLRWQADLLRRLKHEEAAVAVVQRALVPVNGDVDELVENVDWLLERQYWTLVTELSKRFKDEFGASDLLSYRLAESQRRQGNEKAAQEAADQAFKIEMDVAEKNIRAGMDLEERGMFDWAERELRHAMKIAGMESAEHVRARFRLSEMFHDMGKELEGATALQELADAMKKDPNLEQRIEQTGIRDPEAFRARMHYFYAQHYLEKNDLKLHQEHLEKAIAADPKDADVLIAMYRVPHASEAWHAKSKKLIWEVARGFHDELDKFERVANEQPEGRERGELGTYLAMLCNQYAWLVGNTEGDYEEARRCSHKSLELRPAEAGYMDTLARCYYAKKDYDNAVKYQSMAAKKKPHSGQILKQLALFEKARGEKKSE